MLVPAFMRLAGEWNWWAPAPLRRLHDRIGFSEHVDLDAEAGPSRRRAEDARPPDAGELGRGRDARLTG